MKNKFVKIIAFFILIIVLVTIILSLQTANNLEHSSFVVAIGIDKSPTDKEKILVTFQIIPPQVAQDSSSNLSKSIVTSLDEYSINSAIGKIQNYMSTLINFSHTRVLVISKEIAKEGVIKYINGISGSSQFDTNMYIMISTSKAKEYLESLPEKTEINPVLYYNIIKNTENLDSSTKTVTLTEFLKSYYAPEGHSIASLCSIISSNSDDEDTVGSGKEEGNSNTDANNKGNNSSSGVSNDEESSNKTDDSSNDSSGGESSSSNNPGNDVSKKSDIKIQIGGIAVFKKDKLIGTLDRDLCTIHLMVSNKIKNAYIKINHPNKENTKQIMSNVYLWQSSGRKISIKLDNRTPTIDIKIPVNAAINDTEDLEYFFYDREYMDKMKSYIEKKLASMANEYFNKTQKEYGVDIDDFHKILRRKFIFKKDYLEYNWDEKYKQTKVNVNFDIRFISPGISVKK